MDFSKEFSNKRDNNGLSPLLLLAHRLGGLKLELNDDVDAIRKFIGDFITKCHCDVYLSVGKENQDKKVL